MVVGRVIWGMLLSGCGELLYGGVAVTPFPAYGITSVRFRTRLLPLKLLP